MNEESNKKNKFLLVGIIRNNQQALGEWMYVPLAFFSTKKAADHYAWSSCPMFRTDEDDDPDFKEESLLAGYDYYDIWELDKLPEDPEKLPINPEEIPKFD